MSDDSRGESLDRVTVPPPDDGVLRPLAVLHLKANRSSDAISEQRETCTEFGRILIKICICQ